MRHFPIIIVLALLLGCTRTRPFPDDIARAEALATHTPDSALAVLEGWPRTELDPEFDYAAWCLVKTFADYNAYRQDISPEQLETGTGYFIRHGSHNQKALAYYVRAVVSEEIGLGTQAEWVNDMLRATKEVEGSDNHYLASNVNLRYAGYMSDRKWHEEAIPYLEKGIEEAEKAKRPSLAVTGLINLSHAELFLGDADKDYGKAIDAARRAVEVSLKTVSDADYCRALNALSSCYSRDGQFVNALESARESVRMQEKLYRSGAVKVRPKYTALADAFRKVENADSAIFYAWKELESPNVTAKLSGYQVLYMVYRDLLHDDASAVKYMTEYHSLKNELEKSQQEGTVLQNTLQMKDEEARKSKTSILATSVCAIALLAALFALVIWLYRQAVKHRDAKLQLQENQILEGERSRGELRSILIDKDKFVENLRSNPRYLHDADFDRLGHILNKACDNWCIRLREEHPAMTEAEFRTAVLVRFRFGGAQMATMMGISPSSVTKAKQRLKSRISLPVGTALEAFLASF